jgi:uncharacterized membrane protein YsdA (DUF1294 family)
MIYTILFILPVWALTILAYTQGNYIPAAAYLIAIPVTYIAYRTDKKQAKQGGWRTPENTLHLLEILGGWAGALYAQRTIYHKNKKIAYQIVFWLIVLIHQLAAAYIIASHYRWLTV